MIDYSSQDTETRVADTEKTSLQEYVHALLARQKALDLLDSVQYQINEVWSVMRRLLDYTGAAARATQAVRAARAAQASLAQKSYRALEKRRETCLARLRDAENRADAALKSLVAAPPPAAGQYLNSRPLAGAGRSKVKNILAPAC